MNGDIIVMLAVVIGIVPFLIFAKRLSSKIKSEDDYYLASNELSARGLFDTLMATWLLLGNVIVAAMFLGGIYGWLNWWMILTWGIGFWFVGRHASNIKTALGDTQTLHTFLEQKYKSPQIKNFAAIVTFTVGIGIIALELIVGMALLVTFTGNIVYPMVFGVVLGITVTLYCRLGGLTAVVKSDKAQFYGIFAALVVLLVVSLAILLGPLERNVVPPASYDITWQTAFSAGWPFYVGLFFLQVPLLVGDFGTWQRIRASKAHSAGELRRTFFSVGLLNILLWTVLVFAGVAVATIPSGIVDPVISSSLFYASAQPLIDLMFITDSGLIGLNGLISSVLVFIVLVGMIWALLSSADSYLLIALQTWTTDLTKRALPPQGDMPDTVRRGRRAAGWFMFIALLIALITVCSGVPLVSAVFIIFGSQTAVAPLALYALRDDIDLGDFGSVPTVAAILGFSGAILYGSWATFFSSNPFHQNNGAYLSPVIGFLLPFSALVIMDVKKNGWGALIKSVRHILAFDRSAT